MKAFVIGAIVLILAGGIVFTTIYKKSTPSSTPSGQQTNYLSRNGKDSPDRAILAENLDTPWAIAFLPDMSLLVTERGGIVKRISNNQHIPIATLSNVKEISEGGLLGLTLHPDFSKNNYIYLYYTYSSNEGNTLNRVVRMTYENNSLTDEKIIVDQIPGAGNHNGGRIKFGPDNFLYIGTGDAQEPSRAQDTNSLAGKILRVTDEGKTPSGNPFNTPIYSYGHRNVQGLTWDDKGNLWATEHGRSGLQSGLDEINLIQAGKNYGWPIIQGNETRPGMETPRKNSGTTTWAPAGIAFVNDSFFFGGLRGQTLYQAPLQDNQIFDVKNHFSREFGRIREVILGPDNLLYISTSNNDGRGIPNNGDDKIIMINPEKL